MKTGLEQVLASGEHPWIEHFCPNVVAHLHETLTQADAVVIGAGSGLSTAAGFTYSGPRFAHYFADFAHKYGFHDMYTGGFYHYATPEEKWAYWSRYVLINRYMNPPNPTYYQLLQLVKDKDYFILTTNVDHCFQKAGFAKDRLFYTQGDYGLFQCSGPCCDETRDNEVVIKSMVAEQHDMRIPHELIPYCPHCGRPMSMNLRADHTFVEDGGWEKAAQRYDSFIRAHQGKKILFLELGVGYNTPGIIKYPFWQMTYANKQATYVCINHGEAFCPPEIIKQSLCLNCNVNHILSALLHHEAA